MGGLGAVGEAPQMPVLSSVAQVESLGQLLIPTINRLQDLFNQARGFVFAASPSPCLRLSNSFAVSAEVEALLPAHHLSSALQVTLDYKLELPQVAVIGSQSSGKSSVLEALVRPKAAIALAATAPAALFSSAC